MLAALQSVQWSAVKEQALQLGEQGEQVKLPSEFTTWKNPVAQTHCPLTKALLAVALQEVQVVADEQVTHRDGQAEQTALPAS